MTIPSDNKIWHVQQAVRWACERERVRELKESGAPKPWTADTIIQNYRFCNVSRQHDRETVALNEGFYRPGVAAHGERDLWFNVAVARWINWSKSVIAIGWTDLTNGYDADDMYQRMVKATDGSKFFTGAYMIRGCSSPKEVGGDVELFEKCKDKRYFLAHVVFKAISTVGGPNPGETLEAYHGRLTKAKSNGPFMAGQQIADLKYYNMRNAPDWSTWAPWGPGPNRWLNRMNGRPLERNIPADNYVEELKEFDVLFYQELDVYDFDVMIKERVRTLVKDAHDRNSNLLCESDKYVRIQQGGRVRSGYDGKPSTTTKLFN